MKYIKYLCLLAIVVVLGTSCKKEVTAPVKVETVKDVKKVADIRWDLPGTGTPPDAYMNVDWDMLNIADPSKYSSIYGYPDGPMTFPHNSGTCYCGKYSTCHPPYESQVLYPWGYDKPGLTLPPK